MTTTTPRMAWSFPTVAVIRKGAPKQPGKNRKGEDILVVGPDLGANLRIAFFQGADEARKLLLESYQTNPALKPYLVDPKQFIVSRVRAMVPCRNIFDSLEVWNEAHQAGRMVIRATDKQIITQRDPLTGKYLVRDGEPFTPFTPGQPVVYERDGRRYELPVKTTVRFKLFLPDVARMVAFEFKSTSFYDACNLRQQLGAIQMLAEMLNGGVAGGIPFYLYRREQEICWNKKDGSAQRVQKWLINVEVDPAWVEAATRRMTNFALTGTQIAGLLQPVNTLEGAEDPDQAEDLADDENVIDHDSIPDPEPQQHPAIDPPVVEVEPAVSVETPAPAAAQPDGINPERYREQTIAAAPHDKDGKLTRPMAPAVVRAVLEKKAESYRNRKEPSGKQKGLAATLIESVFSGQEEPNKIRYSILSYLFGADSLNTLTGAQMGALLDWLGPTQAADSGEYLINPLAAKELTSIWPEASREAGQQELF